MSSSAQNWWGRHQIQKAQTAYWHIGPLHLWVQQHVHSWQILWNNRQASSLASTKTLLADQFEYFANFAEPLDVDKLEQCQCLFGESKNEIQLTPLLADRTLVTQFHRPVQLLPRDEVVLYVASPIWLKIETLEPSRLLCEVPALRLSDTWMGPPTHQGQLCYASRGPAITDFKLPKANPALAWTPVRVRNQSNEPLHLDRLNIPLPQLALYHCSSVGFCTNTVSFERTHSETEMADLRIDKQAPSKELSLPAGSVIPFVSAARSNNNETHAVFRAFNSLFKDKESIG